MKNIFKTLFILLISTTTFAQTSEKADKLLAQVSSKMSAYNNMYIKFKYTLENKEAGLRQESLGFVTTQKEKYNLNFMDNDFIYDGKKTYVISVEDKEINIIDGDTEEEMLTPSKLLFFYKEGYMSAWNLLKKINGKSIQFIKLTPIDSESESSHFLIGIDTQTKHIHSITDVGINGTQTIFKIEDFKANQAISKNLFTFDKAKYVKENYTINE
jgi:outer membrane lipoprotein-sorting protein